jgi:TetR/AcrR family transcriptional regulator, cholesterol catabolism regulator
MTTTKRPERKNSDLRKVIADKAGELLGKSEYAGITVEQIASQLGISKASIYYHYASKEDIFLEFHRIAHKKALEGIRHVIESNDPPDDKLKLAIEYHIDLLSYEVTANMLYVHRQFSLPKKLALPIKKLRSEYDLVLRKIIIDGIEQGIFLEIEPKIAAYIIAGAINFLPQWFSSKGPLSQKEIKKIITDYLLRGILKKAAK